MSTTEDRKPLGAKVEPELKHEFRVTAAKKGKTMSEYIRELVIEELDADIER